MKPTTEGKMTNWCVEQAISIISADYPVSDFAKNLLTLRANGEIAAEQVRASIINFYLKNEDI